ncbi:feruloyl esterase B precursor protein [Paramyrothecium foliicola]|nr:feruloyl esterase B precursor protein [Paramyrothecium foliicola]
MPHKSLLLSTMALGQQALGQSCHAPNATQACSARRFKFPDIEGTALLDITAVPITNFSAISAPPAAFTGGFFTASFCNVSVTYTHPGSGDAVNVQAWLPSSSAWNNRLQAVGGGGYSASNGALHMLQAVAGGYVALDTDSGHPRGTEFAYSPESWVLNKPGEINTQLVENWASSSLHEMAIIGKAITANYYGSKPDHSYFLGCSGGGRQAMMLAQRYGDDFDGILAGAPAMNIEKILTASYWAAHIRNRLGVTTQPCEIEAFTKAAIQACDGMDGVNDNVISLPNLCDFDPRQVVGKDFSCDGKTSQFTSAGAEVVRAAWTGPQSSDGRIGWFGLDKDASLTSIAIPTPCEANATCPPSPSNMSPAWFRYMVAKDPSFDPSTMTTDQFFAGIQQSQQEYRSLMAADDPDLSGFRAAGGKLIIWHGLADEIIPAKNTIAYMESVLKLDPEAQAYVRFFEAPGVAHCAAGAGPSPADPFAQLRAWVENDTVPETLTVNDAAGGSRELCNFPLQQVYLGGPLDVATSFGCKPKPMNGTLASEAPFYWK